MSVTDELNKQDAEDGATSGSSSMALVERAPWALGGQSYIGTGDLYGGATEYNQWAGASGALTDPRSGYWTMQVPGSERGADATWGALPEATRQQLNAYAKMYHPNSTGESLWKKALAGSAEMTKLGQTTTAFEWLSGYTQSLADGGQNGPGGGGRGYSGPVSQTTLMDEQDVDRTANALALELIGRPLSQQELAKITKRLRKAEYANPTVTTPQGPGGSVTQSGLSAQGREDVLREVIAQNPEYEQFQVDHTVLDTMLAAFDKRKAMVNG